MKKIFDEFKNITWVECKKLFSFLILIFPYIIGMIVFGTIALFCYLILIAFKFLGLIILFLGIPIFLFYNGNWGVGIFVLILEMYLIRILIKEEFFKPKNLFNFIPL